MEPFLADLINNTKAPKWLRSTIVALVCGLVIFLGVLLACQSPMLIGKLFGFCLSALFLAAAIYLLMKIATSRHTEKNK